jgi:hypothetical protein
MIFGRYLEPGATAAPAPRPAAATAAAPASPPAPIVAKDH